MQAFVCLKSTTGLLPSAGQLASTWENNRSAAKCKCPELEYSDLAKGMPELMTLENSLWFAERTRLENQRNCHSMAGANANDTSALVHARAGAFTCTGVRAPLACRS